MAYQVELIVEGKVLNTLVCESEPHSEADLMKNPHYADFYNKVGGGTEALAKVTSNGFFKRKTSEFSYMVVGNSLSNAKFNEILYSYQEKARAASYEGIKDGLYEFKFLFESRKISNEMYEKLEGILNVGIYQFRISSDIDVLHIQFWPFVSPYTPVIPAKEKAQASVAPEDTDRKQDAVKPNEPTQEPVDREVIFKEMLRAMSATNVPYSVPKRLSQLCANETATVEWIIDENFQNFKNRFLLSYSDSFEKLDMFDRMTSGFIGVYAAWLYRRNGKLSNSFYQEQLQNCTAEARIDKMIELMGVTAEEPVTRAQLRQIAKLLPIAAKYCNQVKTPGQKIEACCALFRIGIVLFRW